MVLSFSVSNFRGFAKPVKIVFENAADYQFQNDLVSNGCVSKCVLFGPNGSGKTSLCRAMADIVSLLTENFVSNTLISPLNYGSSNNDSSLPTTFCYELLCEDERIEFRYSRNRSSLLSEELFSNGKLVASCRGGVPFADTNHFPELSASSGFPNYNRSTSFIKYLSRSGFAYTNKTIDHLVDFANRLLFFRSAITGNEFVGFDPAPRSLVKILKDTNSLEEFREFLFRNGIDYRLQIRDSTADPNRPGLDVLFLKESRDFFEVASTGTQYLLLLFAWVKVAGQNASLFLIDEFDAYYHDEVAISVFSLLRSLPCQVLLTSHRTVLMQNSIMRPDCVFLLNNGRIASLPDLTDRELREANNIEKLYRNGAFVI